MEFGGLRRPGMSRETPVLPHVHLSRDRRDVLDDVISETMFRGLEGRQGERGAKADI